MYDHAPVTQTPDYAPLAERAFSFVPRELDCLVNDIEGKIPSFVRGSYYLNGPGRFSRGGVHYRHWLDGDGMICALHFTENGVRFVNRFIRSKKFVSEDAQNAAVFRTFGTAFGGDQLKRGMMIEPPVNVSVYQFAEKLLAFGEQGLPYELDPATLETRGQFDFHQSLNDVSPFAGHPKIDPRTGEIFNFGISFSAPEPFLNLYRFDRAARMIYRRRLRLDYACSLHDFGLSESYAVFYISPYILDMQALARDGKTLQESLSWKPERKSRLLVVERETGAPVCELNLGSRYCLHFINCFESDGLLNVDLLELERPVYDQYQPLPDLFTDVCQGNPVRFVINVGRGELIKTISLPYTSAPDFPSVASHRFAHFYEDFWMLGISATGKSGRKFFDQLVHANWSDEKIEIYQMPPGNYLSGDPVFISNPENEGQGVVLCQLFDAQKNVSLFAFFDADRIVAGPIAVLKLPEAMPPGFHASFSPSDKEFP